MFFDEVGNAQEYLTNKMKESKVQVTPTDWICKSCYKITNNPTQNQNPHLREKSKNVQGLRKKIFYNCLFRRYSIEDIRKQGYVQRKNLVRDFKSKSPSQNMNSPSTSVIASFQSALSSSK
jgi:hypothetical protein